MSGFEEFPVKKNSHGLTFSKFQKGRPAFSVEILPTNKNVACARKCGDRWSSDQKSNNKRTKPMAASASQTKLVRSVKPN